MENKKIYVVTDPELGWDCAKGIFEADDLSSVELYLAEIYDLLEDEVIERFHIAEMYNGIIKL